MKTPCLSCGHPITYHRTAGDSPEVVCDRCGFQFKVRPSSRGLDTVQGAGSERTLDVEASPRVDRTVQATLSNIFMDSIPPVPEHNPETSTASEEGGEEFLGDLERAHRLNAFMEEPEGAHAFEPEGGHPNNRPLTVGNPTDELFLDRSGPDPFDSPDFHPHSYASEPPPMVSPTEGMGPIKRRRFDEDEDGDDFVLTGNNLEGFGPPPMASTPLPAIDGRFTVSEALHTVGDVPVAEHGSVLAEVAQDIASTPRHPAVSQRVRPHRSPANEPPPISPSSARMRSLVGVVVFFTFFGVLGALYLTREEPAVVNAVSVVSEEVSDSLGAVVDEAREEVHDVVAEPDDPRDVSSEVLRKLRKKNRTGSQAADTEPKQPPSTEDKVKARLMKNYIERIETRPDGTEVRVWVRRDMPTAHTKKQASGRKRASAAQSSRRTPAPTLALLTADGKKVNLRQLRGKVVVLNMYATWCPPCKAEIPDFSRFHRESADDVQVYGIVFQSGNGQKATQDSRRLGVDYPILLGDQKTAKRWSLRAFPTTLVIDRKGLIAHRVTGQVNHAQLAQMVEEASR
ncbi:MAG: redoxin domain-containing protein [Myxococcota bacterium]